MLENAGAVACPRGSKLKNNHKCLNLYLKTSCIPSLSFRNTHSLPPSSIRNSLSPSFLPPSLPPSLKEVRGIKFTLGTLEVDETGHCRRL